MICLDAILQIQIQRVRQQVISAAPTRLACLADQPVPPTKYTRRISTPEMSHQEMQRVYRARYRAKQQAARTPLMARWRQA